ncbi:hypothetical protein Dimus_031762, partial [Dionaea muscipula]
KGKIPLEETEPMKEPDVAGSPTAKEMNQQIDDLSARPFISETLEEGVQEEQVIEKAKEEEMIMDKEDAEEEEGERDEDLSASERRRRRRSPFSSKRLSVPPSRVIKKFMGVDVRRKNTPRRIHVDD